jgi:hypothetical protein
MPVDVRTNALDDLLDAERHFRQQAENTMRQLRSVLTEQAQRMAGSLVEDARRTDPNAPDNWDPERWRAFFASLPVYGSGNAWNEGLLTELDRLKAENQSLRRKLSSLSSSPLPAPINYPSEICMEQPDVKPLLLPDRLTTDPQPGEDLEKLDIDPHSGMLAHADLVGELRNLSLPLSLPARFQNHFPKTGLNEADRERQVRRKLYVLYLLSRGLDIRLEIDHLVSQVEGIGSRTGALRRLYDSMVEKNLIGRQVLEMSAPNTSLAMLQLTQDGRQLCQVLGWDMLESERERINRMHQGVQFPQHTLAMMVFAMHARLRAYRVSVLPHMEGVQTRAVPDVAVSRCLPEEHPEMIYVEVELSTKELDEKWQNLAQLQGSVALCARNAQRRARLVGDCKLKNLHGLATDLETLIACKVPEISGDTPLWAEVW